ncbi:MAG: 3-phosphoglycerate dehydrogenase [Chloroflexi bacterium HGW-Chloroflexi-10]|nr:MAG: 3-phosphoglycerate dehydrogenase [Chloroflexi bacterium HGW-Chloroflexi-10]
MTKVLLATDKPFAKEAVIKIKEIAAGAGYELALLEKYTSKEQLLEAVTDADAMIIRSDIVDGSVLDAAKQLKVVVRAGAGYDNIDLQAATAHKVVAMNTPGQNSNAVAELAFGMMVFQARGQFDGKSGSELMGKKLGLHAYGNVGKRVAAIAKGFGMEVYAFDPFISQESIEADGVHCVNSVEELYATCNYISLHIPANSQTKNSINYRLLSSMPKPARLVNTARKEVVHEADLLKIFAERADFQYLSDVAPDCAAEIAENYKGRFYFTPKKMGAQTEEANVNSGLAAIRQIVDFFEKGDCRFQVNK